MERQHRRKHQFQRERTVAVMTEVRKPVLLNANLADERILYPTKRTLKLVMEGVSEATMTLENKAEGIPMHRWVRMYNRSGFVGIFRRCSRGRNIGTDNSYTFKHGIDILQDSIWDEETTFEGTTAEFITAILNKQTQLIRGPGDSAPRKPWVMGSCADSRNVEKDIKYENLLDLLHGLVDEGGGYYFTYNQTVWPWQVSLTAKPSGVASEFRMDRNMEKCQIKDNDSELCTRLILNVNHMEVDEDIEDKTGIKIEQNVSGYRVYNNTAAQENYGIITKMEDIDTESVEGQFPSADAWAADYLARRAEPMLQIEIDGAVLKGITGDDWDESRIGTQVRVALPEYATAITERCVAITYPDPDNDPDRITVSLANALPTFTGSMKATAQTVARTARAGRGSARQAKSFEQHFTLTDEAGNVLRQAGLKLDANGLLVYADDTVNMIGSRFNVQADKIGMVVGTNSDGNYIKAAEIAVSINEAGEGVATIDATKIMIGTAQTVGTWITGKVYLQDVSATYIQGQISSLTSLQVAALTATGEIYIKNSANQSTSLRNAISGVQIIPVPNSDDYKLQYSVFNKRGWHDAGTFSRAASQTLTWTFEAGHSGANDPGSAAKQYNFLRTEDWCWFNVKVNNQVQKVKIHLV